MLQTAAPFPAAGVGVWPKLPHLIRLWGKGQHPAVGRAMGLVEEKGRELARGVGLGPRSSPGRRRQAALVEGGALLERLEPRVVPLGRRARAGKRNTRKELTRGRERKKIRTGRGGALTFCHLLTLLEPCSPPLRPSQLWAKAQRPALFCRGVTGHTRSRYV